jgi:hypothetical protein
VSVDELRQQAQRGRFASNRHRLVWLAIQPLVSQSRSPR